MMNKEEKMRQKEEKRLFKEEKANLKRRIRYVGLHNKRVMLLFALFIISITFGVYKNFTAIDTHTVKEIKVVEEKLLSTNAIESFSKDFMCTYFTWEKAAQNIRQRTMELEPLVDKDLVRYVRDMVVEDIGTYSHVYMLDIWDVKKVRKNEYKIIYKVGQEIGVSEEESKKIEQSYWIQIHVDDDKNMLVTKLPVLASVPTVSTTYKSKSLVEQTSLDVKIKDNIIQFVEDFFTVYPKSTEKELKYYAVDGIMPVLENDSYILSSIDEVIIIEATEKKAKLSVKVVYDSKSTNTKQMYAYDLVLERKDEWKIVEVK